MEAVKPMSFKMRRRMAIASIALFIVLVPVIVLYASGYRFSFTNSKVVSTGGIFVSLSPGGSSFSVDGQYVQSTGLFSNSFFEQDLAPGLHELSVAKEGYETWSKKILVRPNEVSEVNSLLMPEKIVWRQAIVGTTTSTTTIGMGVDQLKSIKALFTGTSTNQYLFPVSTTTARVSGGILLWTEGNTLLIERRASNLQLPAVFCAGGISSCLSRVYIPLNAVPSSVDFYPNRSDVVIVAYESSVFAIEMDNHSPRQIHKLFTGVQPKVRISNGTVYIKDGEKIFMTDQFNG